MVTYKVYLIKEKGSDLIKYVGLTKQSLYKRFCDHVSRRKVNRDKYYISLVQELTDIKEASALEKLLIQQHNTIQNGWNVFAGGYNDISKEHVEKNRVARKGMKNSAYHNKRIGETHAKPIFCITNGKIYSSARVAAKELGLQYSKISLVANGIRNHTGGYKFRFC